MAKPEKCSAPTGQAHLLAEGHQMAQTITVLPSAQGSFLCSSRGLIRLVRHRAKEKINANKVGIVGFSNIFQ